MSKEPRMLYPVYIPTIGYPIGKPTRDIDRIIKFAIDARRKATTDSEQQYYNMLLTDAYNTKYAHMN